MEPRPPGPYPRSVVTTNEPRSAAAGPADAGGHVEPVAPVEPSVPGAGTAAAGTPLADDPAAAALLAAAVHEAARLIQCDGALAYLVDASGGELRFAHDAGITDDRRRTWVRGLRMPVGVGMFGRAVAERRVTLTTDYPSDDAFAHFPDADRVVAEVGMRSMAVAPLVAGDTVLGAMGVFDGRPDAFGEADIALVRTLADHVATAIDNRLLIAQLAGSRAETARRAETERALREIATRIAAIRDPDDLLQRIVDEAARLLGADGARIDLLDAGSGVLLWSHDATTGRRPGLGPIEGDGEAQAGEGISGRAVAERRAIVTGDYLDDDRFTHASAPDEHARRHAIRSAIAAPLMGDAGPLGTLTVYTSEPDAYRDEDAALIEALANQAGIALRNARLIRALAASREESARRADVERALREVATTLTAVSDPAEVLHRIAGAAAGLLGTELVWINIIEPADEGTGWIWYSPTEVGRDPWPARDAISLGEGVTGKAIADRRTFITGDYLHDDRFVHRPGPDRYTAEQHLPSAIAVPMFDGDAPLGAMLAESTEPDAFDEEDAALLEALAQQASLALANARLIEELRRARHETALLADAERTLREVAARITAIRDPAELLQGILDEAARLFRAERAQIDLVGPLAGRAQWAFPPDASVSAKPTDREVGGMSGWAMQSDGPVLTGDYLAETRFEHTTSADAFIQAAGIRAAIAAPLRVDRELLGIIQIGTSRADAYDDDDAALLEGLASQAAIAIANARLIADLARSREELARRAEAERTLREIAATVTALRDPREVIQQAIDAAVALLGGDFAEIGVAESHDKLDIALGATTLPVDPATSEPPRIVPGVGVSGLAFREGRVVRTGDYGADERFSHGPGVDGFLAEHGLRSAIAAPLIVEGRAFGAMTVVSRRQDAFGDEDGSLLQALADQAAIAVANARMITELERSRAEVARRAEAERGLRDIAARIAVLREPEALLGSIVDETKRLLGSDGAHLTLMSEERTTLRPVVITGGLDDATRAWLLTQDFPIDDGINGLAAGRNEPIRTDDYLADDRIPLEPDDIATAERMGIRGMAAAPLRSPDGEVIGTLAISYRSPRSIGDDEIDLLQGLADHAAIALTNGRLVERIRDSEARFRFLVENSPDVVFAIDAEGRFTYMSDSVERLLGRRVDEVVGRHFGILVDEGSMDRAGAAWDSVRADPSVEVSERLDLVGRDGRLVPFEIRAAGDARDGIFAGIHGSARDITERQRLLYELGESEARYRYLVSASPDVVFAVDADGRFTFVSERIRDIAGLDPSSLRGRHYTELLDPVIRQGAHGAWERLVAEPDRVQEIRSGILAADGTAVPVEIHVVGTGQPGRLEGAHGSVRDLRERDRLERDLRRKAAEVAAGEERAHLARELHDSVTQALFSMTLVTRSLEILLERDPSRAAEQLATLRDLQRDALAEMRSLIFELRPGSLEQDGLAHALRTHCAAVEGRVGLLVDLELGGLDGERAPIAVEEAVYRIAQEGLHNVVKHAGASHVRIAVAHDGDHLRMTLQDDGIGFDPASVPPGHLGLAGMRARAERLGGSLVVESTPGQGTTIQLGLPVGSSDDPPEPSASVGPDG